MPKSVRFIIGVVLVGAGPWGLWHLIKLKRLLAANIDRGRTAEKLAIPSATHPLAGFWKVDPSHAFGVAIAPANDGYYSISFCGPGGCFRPGVWRTNSKIVDDDNYRIINNNTIDFKTRRGIKRYTRCLSGRVPG